MQIDPKKVDRILAAEGWSIADVARFTGISMKWLYNAMAHVKARGRFNPKRAGILAKALGVELDEILEDETNHQNAA